MQIVIDTSKDSHEEIRKVIKLLSDLVEDPVYTNAPPEPPESSSAFNAMFGDSAPAPPAEPEKKDDVEVQVIEY